MKNMSLGSLLCYLVPQLQKKVPEMESCSFSHERGKILLLSFWSKVNERKNFRRFFREALLNNFNQFYSGKICCHEEEKLVKGPSFFSSNYGCYAYQHNLVVIKAVLRSSHSIP